MSRSIVWAQVGPLLIVLTAVLVDDDRLPSFLFPPQILLALCGLSVFILPLAVITMGAFRKPKSGQLAVVNFPEPNVAVAIGGGQATVRPESRR